MDTMNNNRSGFISIDTIFFFTLVGVMLTMQFILPLQKLIPDHRGVSALLILILGLYGLVDILVRETGLDQRWVWMVKGSMFAIAIGVIVILPTGLAMVMRARIAPYRFVHDGLIQSEVATRLTLKGKNPYAETFLDTPLEDWVFLEGELEVNPALDHYPYLPLTFLLPLPVQVLIEGVFGWFDQRVVYILIFLLLLLVASKLTSDPTDRSLLLMTLGFNPLMVPFLIEGRNDVISLFWVVLIVYLLQRGRTNWSAAILALACATKQVSWFFVPFYFAWLGRRTGRARIVISLGKPAFIFLGLFGILVLPWFLWDAGAFLGDIFPFQWGLISGMGLSALLLSFGVIPSNTAPFPFWIFQLSVGIPFLIYFLSRLGHGRNLPWMVAEYGLWLFAFLFLGRAFNDNYLGYVLAILVVGAFSDPAEGEELFGQ